MTREEKAKAYDEALEDMRVIYPNLKGDAKLAVEHAFPELTESEDERDSLPEEKPSYVTDSPGDPGNPGEPGISDLEEAAKKYAHCPFTDDDGNFHEDAIDETAYRDFIAGAEWQKEQMMKEAVEGVVYRYESYQRIATAIIVDIPREILGNKVKIIIVKQDDPNERP